MTERDGGAEAPTSGGDGDADPSCGVAPAGESVDGWPATLSGVTETVIATLGPNDRWNHAALGLDAGETPVHGTVPVLARTFGRTRTRRNLDDRGEGYVQLTRDPVDFVAAALDVHETAGPILESADAWVRVRAEPVDRWEDAGTDVVEWRLEPAESAVRHRSVPTTNRGFAAVVEATVAASRLDAPNYEEGDLLERLAWLSDVVETAGSERDRAAFDRIEGRIDWSRE